MSDKSIGIIARLNVICKMYNIDFSEEFQGNMSKFLSNINEPYDTKTKRLEVILEHINLKIQYCHEHRAYSYNVNDLEIIHKELHEIKNMLCDYYS